MGGLEQTADEYYANLKHNARERLRQRMCDLLVQHGCPEALAEQYATQAIERNMTIEDILAVWQWTKSAIPTLIAELQKERNDDSRSYPQDRNVI